jgi:ADP-heptose:LPS heptosyltransferase
MDYTHRDFVVLQALGIERKHTAIELRLTPEAEAFKQTLLASWPKGLPVVGLNIGCATEGAESRRPDLVRLAQCLRALSEEVPHRLLISGAPFEAPINQAFMKACGQLGMNMDHVMDCSGRTSLPTLAGLIDACDLFISSDSGPYHVSVALHKPTLCWFNSPDPAAYHQALWVKCLLNPDPLAFVSQFKDLMSSQVYQA